MDNNNLNLFSLIDCSNNETDQNETFLKCFQSELKSVKFLTLQDLFFGFQTIKIITFSYNIDFVNEITKSFDYAEVLLGSSFLAEKDKKLQEYLAETLTNTEMIGQTVPKYQNLVNMLQNNNIEFRTPFGVLDHRKLYLLKSDDGRTRVIKTSANLSKAAWDSEHLEHYEYDDSAFCYEEYLKEFETAWSMSQPIPFEVFSSKPSKNGFHGDAILKDVKEKNEVLVLQQIDSPLSFESVKYTIDHKNLKGKYKEILENVPLQEKDGVVKITPKIIEKIEHNKKKWLSKKIEFKNTEKPYPEMTFDFYKNECYLDEIPIDTNPTNEEVEKNIKQLIDIFSNFNQFVGNVEQLQSTHFKLMNALFCSPFNAVVRCATKIEGRSSAAALPLFALVSSETANSGKTFMIKAALKMMTGKELSSQSASEAKKDSVRYIQAVQKGVPVFIDEINNSYLSNIKDIIKNPEKCEENQFDGMPMIVFASNDVLKPDETLRKRMIFFTIDGALPSTIDKTAYESKGKAILKELDTGFYREYLKRMMIKIREELDFIIHSKDIPDEYYSDLMAISSDVILSIFQDYGYEAPSFMRHLTWEKDYSVDSNADNTIQEIGLFCRQNKKMCSFTKENVIIELGSDSNSKKKIDSWKNILPAEMKTNVQSTKDSIKITIDRKELEKRLGYHLGGIFSLKKR